MNGLWVGDRSQDINRTLVHTRHHRLNVSRCQTLVLHHLQQRIHRGVGVTTRGVVLERRLHQGPALSQSVGELVGISIGGHALGHALLAHQNVLGTRDPFLRHIGREQSSTTGMRSVQLFGIGRISEKGPKTGGLGTRRPKGIEHLARGQMQQPTHSGSGRQSPHRRSGVENLVV